MKIVAYKDGGGRTAIGIKLDHGLLPCGHWRTMMHSISTLLEFLIRRSHGSDHDVPRGGTGKVNIRRMRDMLIDAGRP